MAGNKPARADHAARDEQATGPRLSYSRARSEPQGWGMAKGRREP